jgi:molybdopterin-guanine dinucleotide biosynthesis protein A
MLRPAAERARKSSSMSDDVRAAGFVLAGGASSRMGRDKALLELDGCPLLVRAARLLESVVATVTIVGPPERLAGLGFPVVADDWPGAGPLGGIATALRVSACGWNLIVACDLPYLTTGWLEYLVRRAQASAADAVLPEGSRGAEPLCAVYHQRCRPVIAAALAGGVRKVTDGLAGSPPLAVERVTEAEWKAFDSDGWLFKNMNTPADYEQARGRLESKRAR